MDMDVNKVRRASHAKERLVFVLRGDRRLKRGRSSVEVG